MNTRIYVAKELIKYIKNGELMMKEFPHLRGEYLEETLNYSKALYEVLKEVVIP